MTKPQFSTVKHSKVEWMSDKANDYDDDES